MTDGLCVLSIINGHGSDGRVGRGTEWATDMHVCHMELMNQVAVTVQKRRQMSIEQQVPSGQYHMICDAQVP